MKKFVSEFENEKKIDVEGGHEQDTDTDGDENENENVNYSYLTYKSGIHQQIKKTLKELIINRYLLRVEGHTIIERDVQLDETITNLTTNNSSSSRKRKLAPGALNKINKRVTSSTNSTSRSKVSQKLNQSVKDSDDEEDYDNYQPVEIQLQMERKPINTTKEGYIKDGFVVGEEEEENQMGLGSSGRKRLKKGISSIQNLKKDETVSGNKREALVVNKDDEKKKVDPKAFKMVTASTKLGTSKKKPPVA